MIGRRAGRATSGAAALPDGVSPWKALPGVPRVERLGNGLTVCLLENQQAPIVTSALFLRAGTRDEPAGHGGVAHFLEHMMFKGGARYGPGEIDRRTQALGGSNNAFTGHDATAYYFNFASDRWTEGLEIEADRMSGLTLDPEQVASERQVILEELAMYASEPWDALEIEVQANLFRSHPYGRAVLGTREELLATGPADLRDFHRRFYRPDNAVLVVAGELAEGPDGALRAIERTLGSLPAGADARPLVPDVLPLPALERIERRKGEVPRLLLALPGPSARHPDHAPLRLLLTLLGSGRSSRLHRALVDEGQLCVGVSSDLSDGPEAGQLGISAEVVPGIAPAAAEEELMRQLAMLRERAPDLEEVERARRIAFADWVFGHERVHQQALSAAHALTFHDLGHIERHLAEMLATGPERLQELAVRYLDPERGGILGWSLPKADDSEGDD